MLVWRRDQGRCVKCGSNEKLEFDHIIPLSRGGSNTFRNVQLLVTIQGRCPGGPHFVLVLFVAISYALVDEAGAQAAIAPCAEAA